MQCGPMAGRCSMWSTTAHPSTFSHRRALCMLTSTCTSGAAVNPKREILHVCRGKGLPKNFWMEGVGQFRERASHSPFGWMFSRTQTTYQFTVWKAVPVQQETLNMKAKENHWSYSRLIQQVFEHTHRRVPTLLQDSQDCHSGQPMNLIQHTDFSRP